MLWIFFVSKAVLMFLKQEKKENFLDGSTRIVSVKPKKTKMKLKAERMAANQMGSSGEKKGLTVGSESFPPIKAPTTKEIPAMTEKWLKFFVLRVLFLLKSEMEARQMDPLLAKMPVMRRPKKRRPRW